jgi:hypothetical protein
MSFLISYDLMLLFFFINDNPLIIVSMTIFLLCYETALSKMSNNSINLLFNYLSEHLCIYMIRVSQHYFMLSICSAKSPLLIME